MIPKTIIQIQETFRGQKSDDYEYKLLNISEIRLLLQTHTIHNLSITEEKYNHIEFLKLYYLYVYGGIYIYPDIILKYQINEIIKNYNYVFLKTSTYKLSTNFMGVVPKSPIIYELLYKATLVDDISSFDFNLELYQLYTKYRSTITNIMIYDIDILKPIQNPKKTIGITIDSTNLHTIYIADVLSHEYPTLRLISLKKQDECVLFNSDEYFKYDFDVYIISGFIPSLKEINRLRKTGCKIVLYRSQNDYVFDTEKVLFADDKKNTYPYFAEYKQQVIDQVWTPCPEKMHDYWKIQFRCDVVRVPFVWTPPPMEKCMYKIKSKTKKIACFETNKSISSYALSNVFTCENAYRKLKDKNLLEKLYITSTTHERFSIQQFSRMTYNLNLYMDNKLSVEGTFNPLEFMSKYADIVVSHQWGNQIHSYYLDLIWMGWPVLHNTDVFKNIGYYYPQFDYTTSGSILRDIILNHDATFEHYIEKNRSNLNMFMTSNPLNIQQFKILIDCLV